MSNSRFLILFIFLLGIVWPLAAQNGAGAETLEAQYLQEPMEVNAFDRDEWERLKETLSYETEVSPEEAAERRDGNGEGEEIIEPPRRRITFFDSGVWSVIARAFILIALAGGIAFLVWYMLRYKRPKNTKIAKAGALSDEELEKIEENLHESDLERYIRRALEQEQYELAIRLYYLAILKELSLGQFIRWKKDKTNRDYLLEMQSEAGFDEFRDLTNIFESVWYGDKMLDRTSFQQLEPRYRKFMEQIGISAST